LQILDSLAEDNLKRLDYLVFSKKSQPIDRLFEDKTQGGEIAERTEVREHIFPTQQHRHRAIYRLALLIKKEDTGNNNFRILL